MADIKQILYPKAYVSSIYEYDFDLAYRNGKRLVLFDIDNTMVPHGAPADEKSKAFISSLKEKGWKLCAVSNNKEPRVKMFCDAAGVPYIFSAGKPGARGYLDGAEKTGTAPEEAIFFGDQIFTDIIGANNAGIESVLVRPIDKSTDEIQIVLKRILEKPIIKAYFKEKGLAIEDYII
ncbi:MAG: HAD hydrolase-like protein [Eubacteriales bacterium]|nr:HAD hydrolase-like protein [Eubacteriales bacterium]